MTKKKPEKEDKDKFNWKSGDVTIKPAPKKDVKKK